MDHETQTKISLAAGAMSTWPSLTYAQDSNRRMTHLQQDLPNGQYNKQIEDFCHFTTPGGHGFRRQHYEVLQAQRGTAKNVISVSATREVSSTSWCSKTGLSPKESCSLETNSDKSSISPDEFRDGWLNFPNYLNQDEFEHIEQRRRFSRIGRSLQHFRTSKHDLLHNTGISALEAENRRRLDTVIRQNSVNIAKILENISNRNADLGCHRSNTNATKLRNRSERFGLNSDSESECESFTNKNFENYNQDREVEVEYVHHELGGDYTVEYSDNNEFDIDNDSLDREVEIEEISPCSIELIKSRRLQTDLNMNLTKKALKSSTQDGVNDTSNSCVRTSQKRVEFSNIETHLFDPGDFNLVNVETKPPSGYDFKKKRRDSPCAFYLTEFKEHFQNRQNAYERGKQFEGNIIIERVESPETADKIWDVKIRQVAPTSIAREKLKQVDTLSNKVNIIRDLKMDRSCYKYNDNRSIKEAPRTTRISIELHDPDTDLDEEEEEDAEHRLDAEELSQRLLALQVSQEYVSDSDSDSDSDSTALADLEVMRVMGGDYREMATQADNSETWRKAKHYGGRERESDI